MNNRIRIARGTTNKIKDSTEITAVGQPFYDTDKKYLYIGQEGKALNSYTEDDCITSNRLLCQQPIFWNNDDTAKLSDQAYYIHPTYNAALEIHTGSNHSVGIIATKTWMTPDYQNKDYVLFESRMNVNGDDRHSVFEIPNDGELVLNATKTSAIGDACQTRFTADKMCIYGDYRLYYMDNLVSSPTIELLATLDNDLGMYKYSTINVNTDTVNLNATLNVDYLTTDSIYYSAIGTSDKPYNKIYGNYIYSDTSSSYENIIKNYNGNWYINVDNNGNLIFSFGG